MDLYVKNFSVRLTDNTKTDSFSNNGETILEIVSDNNLFKVNPSVIIADPFLFVNNGELFLFYEKQVRWYGRGYICMRKTSDLNTWTDEAIVLVEPFHLSFPYVFEDKGHIYMVPETGRDGSIRLYECTDTSLANWSLVTKLINDGKDWVDSSIIEDNGKYYLFSAVKETQKPYEQRLFISDNIAGPYTEHPCSPIYIGNDYGRNAGSVFYYDNKWIRPTQDCSVGYGDNVSLFSINKLSATEYQEIPLKKDILYRMGKYKEGGHQFNHVVFKGRTIVATDFKTKNYNIIEFVRRLLRKVKG